MYIQYTNVFIASPACDFSKLRFWKSPYDFLNVYGRSWGDVAIHFILFEKSRVCVRTHSCVYTTQCTLCCRSTTSTIVYTSRPVCT